MSWTFERVAGPFKGRTGGMAWDGRSLLISAVADEQVLRFDPQTGETGIFRKWTGRVNGLALASDGSVFGAQEGGRRIVQFRTDGSTAPTHDLLDGAHHNQPVDVIVDSLGRVWMADAFNAQPPYGPPAYPFLAHASVLRLDPTGPDSWRLLRITHDTCGPRAVLLSADERTLYVADGDIERGDICQLFSYPISPYGSAGPCRTMLTFTAVDRGIEGMCLDADGNIIACMGWKKAGEGPSILVISPSGTILESHPAPEDLPMRCAFGGAELDSLYLTSGSGSVYRARGTGHRGGASRKPRS